MTFDIAEPVWRPPQTRAQIKAEAEARFRARVIELGGTPVFDRWEGSGKPHLIICANGHYAQPRPNYIQKGGGICSKCSHMPEKNEAEVSFRARVIELGGTPMFDTWKGASQPHHIVCANGHSTYLRPYQVKKGSGICRKCYYMQVRSETEVRFRARVIELGGKPVFEEWRGVDRPHHVICSKGHNSYPYPSGVLNKGRGICIRCVYQQVRNNAEAQFRVRIIQLGGTPVFEEWKGSDQPHHIICDKGHDAYPRPNGVKKGRGICGSCAGINPLEAERKFRERVSELGGTPAYLQWNGALTRLHVICAKGHHAYPRPANISQGEGICRLCSGKTWDVFYIVTGHSSLKMGITSGNPAPRLSNHRKDGYTDVAFIATNLEARELETQILEFLSSTGFMPVHGNEYFQIDALPVILSELDAYGLTNEAIV